MKSPPPRNLRKLTFLKLPAFLFFLAFSLLIANQANAVNVFITGPTTVCPKNETEHTYTANSYQVPFNFEVNCNSYVWVVYKGNDIVGGGFGKTFSFRFEDIGVYEIEVGASNCGLFGDGNTIIQVNSRVIIPNPIVGPIMCFSGQSYSFTTSPSLASQNPRESDCYYHFAYLWTAPAGWSINGSGNTYFTNETVNITAPVNTPEGSYTISVQGSIPYGGTPFEDNSWFSTPRTYTVQVGPFSASQVSVSGTLAVCNGNSYTYTANIPGGHRTGYTYSWTYPSGWSVENTSTNTIRLYVPSSNSSYGPIRVSVNNGCGTTPFTGVTVFPCNYMMSSGNFKIYPNPSYGELNIEYFIEEDPLKKSNDSETHTEKSNLTNTVFKVDVFDRAEKLVRSGESIAGKVYFDTKGLQPGTYFLHIYSGKEVLREQIFIK